MNELYIERPRMLKMREGHLSPQLEDNEVRIEVSKEDFMDAIKILSDPTFNVDSVISKIYPFVEYEQAYKDALSGECTKIVLDFRP